VMIPLRSEFDGCRDKIMVRFLNAKLVPDMRSWSQGCRMVTCGNDGD
jgi:hypothetical protein